MSRNPDDWMWNRARSLLDQADRVQRQFFRPAGERHCSWEPPVDVFETKTELWVLVALPGVAPDCVKAEIDGDSLVVAGSRSMPAALRRAVVERLEIPHGRFQRAVRLPDGRFELQEAKVENGCMVISLKRVR